MSRKILVLDSSQISTYLECQRRWHFINVEQLALIDEPEESEAMLAGTYGHKLLEIYYHEKALGLTASEAASKALAFDFDNQKCVCGHGVAAHKTAEHFCADCGELIKKAEQSQVPFALHDFYCPSHDFKPQPFPLSQEKRKQIRSRFDEYWMIYSVRDFEPFLKVETDGFGQTITQEVSLEQGFAYKVFEDEEHLFVLEGRIDLLGSMSGQRVVVDHKWQFIEKNLYSKAIQMRNYCLAADATVGIHNYIRLHKEVSKTTFQRVPVNFSPLERMRWKEELVKIFFDILRNPIRENWADCGGKFGYPCPFTKICEEWNEGTKQAIKETHFKRREKFRPW